MEYSKTVPHTYIYNVLFVLKHKGVRHGRDRMGLDLQLPVQSLPITTNVVSLNPTYGEVHLLQHYVIKLVSDL